MKRVIWIVKELVWQNGSGNSQARMSRKCRETGSILLLFFSRLALLLCGFYFLLLLLLLLLFFVIFGIFGFTFVLSRRLPKVDLLAILEGSLEESGV